MQMWVVFVTYNAHPCVYCVRFDRLFFFVLSIRLLHRTFEGGIDVMLYY